MVKLFHLNYTLILKIEFWNNSYPDTDSRRKFLCYDINSRRLSVSSMKTKQGHILSEKQRQEPIACKHIFSC